LLLKFRKGGWIEVSFFYKPYTQNLFQLINSTIKKQYLQNKPSDAQPKNNYHINHINLKGNKIIGKKRTSLSTFLKPGSLTVEAAMVLPLFLFAIIAVLYIIQIIYTYDILQQGLVNTAKVVSAYAYQDDYKEELFYLEFLNNLDFDYLSDSAVIGGFYGIDFSETNFDEESQRIDLIINYRVKNVIDIFNIPYLSIHQCVSAKAWTGYRDPESNSDVESGAITVYVTENGRVYHSSKSCTHLDLSIRMVIFSQVESLRNENGAKYYGCEKCCRHDEISPGEQVYITDSGTNYHSELSCSGLKRTIYEVLLDEQMTLPPCSRCAK